MARNELGESRTGNFAFEEYQIVQLRIAEFDKLLLTIKSWSITSSAVAIGFGFINEMNTLFLLGALGALLFWYLEALNKVFQTALIERSIDLEPMLRGEVAYDGVRTGDYFKRMTGFSEPFRAVWIMLTYMNVNLPHGFIVLAGTCLYFFDFQL